MSPSRFTAKQTLSCLDFTSGAVAQVPPQPSAQSPPAGRVAGVDILHVGGLENLRLGFRRFHCFDDSSASDAVETIATLLLTSADVHVAVH